MAKTTRDKRRLPYVLQIASERISLDEANDVTDSGILFRDRARLTGNLTATRSGGDVEISDIGVSS